MEDDMSASLLSRRTLVSSAAALPALAVPAVAASAPDNELRRLWSEYLDRLAEYDTMDEKVSVARAAYDAELPPCPDNVVAYDHWRAFKWLWDKYGLDPLCDAWNEASNRVDETVEAIQRAPAESLFGIGVKLTALATQHEEWDLQEATQATLTDIDRLIGGDFSRASAQIDRHSLGSHVERLT
jgi:hypothetical protein